MGEEHRPKVPEEDITAYEGRGNRELRRIHNVELNDVCSSPNIIREIKLRRMRWAVHVACTRERSGAYRGLVGETEGKRQLGRPGRRWENYI